MKTIRKTYPRVREYSKRGKVYWMVDLRRKHYVGPKWKNFTDKTTAMDYASAIGDKVSQSGLNSISQIGADPRISAWTEQFAVFGKTVEEAIQVALDVFTKQRIVKDSPFMGELLNLWMLDKIENKLKPLRPRTAKTIRAMATTFKKDFGTSRIKEIDQKRIEEYLHQKGVSNQTAKNIRNYLNQFFGWCVRKHYHDSNPAEKIEIHVQNGTPKFFTVEQCEEIMKKAPMEVRAYFAICLFGGVRPLECERMEWDTNVKLGTKELYIPASISKTKRDRLIVMSDNLFAWLDSCKDQKPLIHSNHRKHRDKVVDGLSFEWIADGLRHSYATYHYAKHTNLELLRRNMGNSPAVIERFYKGVIPQAEVEKFWSIVP